MPNESLFGITNSNRSGKDLWGKNQFNSSFPAALACYMRAKGHKAVYLSLNKELEVVANEITIDELFNTTVPNEDIKFEFESKYQPYQRWAFDDIRNIDLVLRHGADYLRALEVKLTVIPDNTTHLKDENLWSSELVIRPATTSYCALGIADSCSPVFDQIKPLFESVGASVQDWNNTVEISSKQSEIVSILNKFQSDYHSFQKPFLLQPIWKTKGKSPILADNAFDLFVWSDFALCRTFLDKSEQPQARVNRYMRSSARLFKILFEITQSGRVSIEKTYAQMTFGHQTDKEFALSGLHTARYMASPRRYKPLLPPSVLKEIILNGGEKLLSPERRFDQSIYYTASSLFNNK